MASHSGNRSGYRPPDMHVSPQHGTGIPNSQPSTTVATVGGLPTAKSRALLAEAVDAVVNTFAKHSRGYGRGELLMMWAEDLIRLFAGQQATAYHMWLLKLTVKVYCNRSCLWICGCVCVCLWVCYHNNLKLHASIFTKLGR